MRKKSTSMKEHCSLDDLCRHLESRRHGRGYYHLTIWSFLCKMLDRVRVPGRNEAHQMLRLRAAVKMNDENDKKCGNGVYFTCFSFGPAENISMWTNYGVPNQEAVRIRFSRSAMTKWLNAYKDGAIGVYGVEANGDLVELPERPEAKLVDIAYWSKYLGVSNKQKIKDPNEGVLRYMDRTYVITDPVDWRERMDTGELKYIAYMFKETGWQYENETRLVLLFKTDLADRFTHVAVEFDGPYSELEKKFKTSVTQGPWFSETFTATQIPAGSHFLSEARKSVYWGTLNMRSVCDSCGAENKARCTCPFRGQR